MSKNRCVICGLEVTCKNKQNWRYVACSYSHYLEYLHNKEKGNDSLTGGVTMPYNMRVCVGNIVYDVDEYEVTTNDIIMKHMDSDEELLLSKSKFVIVMKQAYKDILKNSNIKEDYLKIEAKDYNKLIKYSSNKKDTVPKK